MRVCVVQNRALMYSPLSALEGARSGSIINHFSQRLAQMDEPVLMATGHMCMCVHVYVCTCSWTYVCMYVHIHIHMHTYTIGLSLTHTYIRTMHEPISRAHKHAP